MTGGVANGAIAFGQGTLNISGGRLNNIISLTNSAVATISNITLGAPAGGPFTAGTFEARNSSIGNVSNTTIGIDLNAFDASKLTLDASHIGRDLFARNSTGFVKMTGGGSVGRDVIAGQLTVNGATSANIEMSGVAIARNLNAAGPSIVKMNGGSVGGNVFHSGWGQTELTSVGVSGNVTFLDQFNVPTCAMTITGGTIAGSLTAAIGTFNMSGATVSLDVVGDNCRSMTVVSSTINGSFSSHRQNRLTLGSSTIAGDLTIRDSSLAAFHGGTVHGAVNVTNSASLTLVVGTFETDLTASSAAQFDMTGGSIVGDVTGQGTSDLTLSGGTVGGSVEAQGTSAITLDGVAVTGDATAIAGTLNLKSQSVGGRLLASQSGNVFMTGGTVTGEVGAAQSGQLEMSGGTAAADVRTVDGSSIRLAGGNVAGDVRALNTSSITLDGAAVAGKLLVQDDATFFMTAGTASGGIGASGNGKFFVSGGTATGGATAIDAGEIHVASFLHGDLSAFDHANGFILKDAGLNGNALVAEGARLTIEGTVNGDVIGADLFDPAAPQCYDVSISGTARNITAAGLGSMTVLAGGVISGSVQVLRGSGVNVEGGVVEGQAFASLGSVTVTNSGAIRGNVDVGYLLTLIGNGTVDGSVTVHDSVIGLGTFAGRCFIGSPVPNGSLTSGHVGGDVTAFEHGKVDFASGSIGGNLIARDFSAVEITGGTVSGGVFAYESGKITMTGGTVLGTLEGFGDTEITFSGGQVVGGGGGPPAPDLAALTLLDAASVLGDSGPLALIAHDNATLNIVGFDLVATLLDPDYLGAFSAYQLTGTLADGTPVTGGVFYVQNGGAAQYNLVVAPEPSAIAGLLVFAGAAACRRGRRRPAA